MKDPVCGMQVSDDTSVTSTYQGKKYSFCGEKCKQEFDKNPQRFAGSGQSQSQQQKEPSGAHR